MHLKKGLKINIFPLNCIWFPQKKIIITKDINFSHNHIPYPSYSTEPTILSISEGKKLEFLISISSVLDLISRSLCFNYFIVSLIF